MPLMKELSSPTTERRSPSEEDRSRKIRIKNRRKLYLDRHLSYFKSPDLELSDPLLYDRCVRRFQTPAEREADGKAKGYSGVLEADLYRSEAKLAAIRRHDPTHFSQEPLSATASSSRTGEDSDTSHADARGGSGQVMPEEEDEIPKTKEEGWERWMWEMTLRFLKGEDHDFDYKSVDDVEEYDEEEGRDLEEKWFDEEEPEWRDSISGDESGGEGEGSKKESKGTGGETGIQDF